MGRELLLKRLSPLIIKPCSSMITFGINSRFQELFPTWGQITHAFLTLAPLRYCYRRSTCMPNPCRQRSFWARIKLSVQKLFCSRQVCLCFFTFSKSWIHVRFKFSLSKLNSVCITVWIWLGPFALFNFSRNTGFFNPLYFIHSASFWSGATSS